MQMLTLIEGVPPLEELQRYNGCGAAADEERAGAGPGDLSSLVAALPGAGGILCLYCMLRCLYGACGRTARRR